MTQADVWTGRGGLTLTQGVLPGGATLAVERIPDVASVGLVVHVPAGAGHDSADRLGASAMWSELVFRGAGDLDSRAQADAMDRAGMTRASDVTPRSLRLAFSFVGDELDAALPLIVDLLRRPRMTADAVEATRELSLQALAGLSDDPQERAMLECRRLHQPRPWNRSGYGDEAGLRALTRDELAEGWSARCRPGGVIIGVAGDATWERVVDRLSPLLEGWEGDADPVAEEAPEGRGRQAYIEDDSAQSQIVISRSAPGEEDDASAIERVAGAVLSGGMSARLFTEVREKRGLCYAVGASFFGEHGESTVRAYVGTTPDRAQESLDVLVHEMNRLGAPGGEVTRDEFDRAAIGLKTSLTMAGESTGGRAGALVGDLRRMGRARPLDEVGARIGGVTLDALNAYLAAREPAQWTIVALGPKALDAPGPVQPAG